MKDTIIINVNKYNTEVALLDCDKRLKEFYIEETNRSKIVGNIYKGRVMNVINGMQAAFVNIGLERNAFLCVTDLPPNTKDFMLKGYDLPSINLKEGDEIICQVIKDEVGNKGAKISANISIAGRYIVYTPTLKFVGVSRKIEDEKKRKELEDFLKDYAVEKCGGIARTACLQADIKSLEYELKAHEKIWKQIQERFTQAKYGEIIFEEADLANRALRDFMSENVGRIITNNANTATSLNDLFSALNSNNDCLIDLKPEGSDLSYLFGLRKQIDSLLDTHISLSEGGYLVIERTEALTVIDVNSGRFVGTSNLQDTVFRVNMDACNEIARQIQLRNIGGIIIVDFIDMEQQEHRDAVLAKLTEAVKNDRIKCRVVGMTSLGLVELTRKKIRNSISHYLQEPCQRCKGLGLVMTPSTISSKIARAIQEQVDNYSPLGIVIKARSNLIEKLYGGELSDKCSMLWQDIRIYFEPCDTFENDDFTITSYSENIITLSDKAKMLY